MKLVFVIPYLTHVLWLVDCATKYNDGYVYTIHENKYIKSGPNSTTLVDLNTEEHRLSEEPEEDSCILYCSSRLDSECQAVQYNR